MGAHGHREQDAEQNDANDGGQDDREALEALVDKTLLQRSSPQNEGIGGWSSGHRT